MKESLKKWLAENNIQYILHTHPAVFTVPEAKIHCGHIPGTHCKNLFLKNKKSGQLYLVTIPYNKRLDLNQYRKMIGAPKVRFAGPEDLLEVLGITPGAVSICSFIKRGRLLTNLNHYTSSGSSCPFVLFSLIWLLFFK